MMALAQAQLSNPLFLEPLCVWSSGYTQRHPSMEAASSSHDMTFALTPMPGPHGNDRNTSLVHRLHADLLSRRLLVPSTAVILHEGECENFSNRVLVAQEHYEPVEAQTPAACWWQPQLESSAEWLVDPLRFFVPGGFLPCLFFEA